MPPPSADNSGLRKAGRMGSLGSAGTIGILSATALLTLFLSWLAIHDRGVDEGTESPVALESVDGTIMKSGMHNIHVNRPLRPPRVDTGFLDLHGNVVTVDCSTCHATRKPNFENKTVSDLDCLRTRGCC